MKRRLAQAATHPASATQSSTATAPLLGAGVMPVGLSYGAMPVIRRFRRWAFRPQRFLFVVLTLLAVPLVPALGQWLASGRGHHPGWPSLELSRTLGLAALALHLLYAYLLAKTSEAAGRGFGLSLLLALIPGLGPAAWARVADRSLFRPYLWLALEGGLFLGCVHFAAAAPYLLFILIFLLLPFVMAQMLGCAVGPVARTLGVTPCLMFAWICLVPSLLVGLLLWEVYGLALYSLWQAPLASAATELTSQMTLDSLWGHLGFRSNVLLYLAATFIIWIKVTYDDLKNCPPVDLK